MKRLGKVLVLMLVVAVAATIPAACSLLDDPAISDYEKYEQQKARQQQRQEQKEAAQKQRAEEREAKVTHTVEFKSNGGTEVEAVEVEDGDVIMAPTCEREGYKLAGWYSDKNLVRSFDFKTAITEDLTLYAGWQKRCTITLIEYKPTGYLECKVTAYEGEALSNVTSARAQMQLGNLKVKEDEDSNVETEYQFVGWYLQPGDDQVYDLTTPVTRNFNLYARWEAEGEFTVTTVCTVDEAVVTTPHQVQKGHVYSKELGYTWYTDEEYTTLYDFNKPVYTDITIYGKTK